MKVLLCMLFGLVAALAHPMSTPRYMWMPDGDGEIHLVDLEETEEVTPFVNPVNDIILQVFTRNNPTTAQFIRIENNQIAANFNPSAQTRFVIHGWNSAPRNLDHIRAAYIADTTTNYNVILVDWSRPASASYNSAKSSTRLVGEYLAQVVTYLRQRAGVNLDNVRLVGHSLGAHIAGVAGNRLGSAVGSIVGLDPAGPLFGSESLANRLDHSDAKYVQVIHTCTNILGWDGLMGDADFYPNSGRTTQPGCGIDLTGSCSHSRAHQFFSESITTRIGFNSRLCSSWNDFTNNRCNSNTQALMGEKANQRAIGSFFLRTGSSSPYAQG